MGSATVNICHVRVSPAEKAAAPTQDAALRQMRAARAADTTLCGHVLRRKTTCTLTSLLLACSSLKIVAVTENIYHHRPRPLGSVNGRKWFIIINKSSRKPSLLSCVIISKWETIKWWKSSHGCHRLQLPVAINSELNSFTLWACSCTGEVINCTKICTEWFAGLFTHSGSDCWNIMHLYELNISSE